MALQRSEATVQALNSLPDHLLPHLIRSFPKKLLQKLALLPEAYHAATLLVEFPEVEKDGIFQLENSDLSPMDFTHVFPALAKLGQLVQHIQLTGCSVGFLGGDSLGAHIPKLKSLTALSLQN